MVPIIAAVLSTLASNGLGLLAGAIQAKGKEVIEDKLGIKIPNSAEALTPELIAKLKEKEMEHEEFLVDAQIRKHEIILEAEKVAAQEVTKRWEADMLSDSYLSKNIRPLSFAGVLIGTFFLALLSAFELKVEATYVSLLGELLKIMAAAYFVGRTVEKTVDVYQGWQQTKGD